MAAMLLPNLIFDAFSGGSVNQLMFPLIWFIKNISMAKQTPKAAEITLKKLPQQPVTITYLLPLIAYGFVTVLTPNLKTLDSNGPKFLTLAILNLATFIFLFTRKELKNRPEWYYAFFRNGIGTAYTGLIIVSLISFFKAINVLESVLCFAKVFTAFSAAYLVSILIVADKRNVKYLCAAMTILLIFDSLTVFSEIIKYIQGKVVSISEIKSIYSNKNILASSIFVKIPFALWLMVFSRKWLKTLGIIGISLAIIATLFMSTRAFYLGIIGLTISFILFLLIRFKHSNDKYYLKLTGIYLTLLLSAFLVFSTTQRFLYPQTQGAYDVSVGARLATISTKESSGAARLEGWTRSWHVFKEDPIFGVGLGNWKIVTLKEENLTSQNFTYLFKAHNDFIEITTETGIFGGLLFLSIFLLIGWAFFKTLLRNSNTEWLTLLFLPAFGLFCYSFDAFFNFPQDRPEIQAMFALYVGIAIALISMLSQKDLVSVKSNPIKKPDNTFYKFPFIIVFGLLLTISVGILYQNFNSLKLQYIVRADIKDGKLTQPAALFLNGFPAIPNLNAEGEPIAVEKASYLINEKRYNEAITLLKKDNSSPFHALREYYLSMAFKNQNNIDSSLAYMQKLYIIKPCFFQNISAMCDLLKQKGMNTEAESIIDKYLSQTKDNNIAWLYASYSYDKWSNLQKAVSIIDSASNYFPTDSLVLKQQADLKRKVNIEPYLALYDTAYVYFKAKNYPEATRYFSELLTKKPDFPKARDLRALCYYSLKDYTKSIRDLDYLISSAAARSNLYNLYNMRGVNYGFLGNLEEACKNYKIATDMGDKDGLENYAKFCQAGNK